MRGITIITALALASGIADAYSVRVHVYGANLVAEDVADDGKVDLGKWGTYTVDRDVYDAIRMFPAYFRAGAVGPDGYPDIFTGQAFTHGDQSDGLVDYLIDRRRVTCQYAVNQGWCGACDAQQQCTSPKDQIVPHRFVTDYGDVMTRPKQFWRSIDWAQALIEDARREVRDAAGLGIEDRQRALQALAFAFGYLMHYAGDGFAHQWVNLYAEGAWDYFDESLAPEYRHVALERYIEHLMSQKPSSTAAWTDRNVEVPVWFVRKYLVEKYIGGCTIDPKAQTLSCTEDSAASKAAHLRFLLGYRQALEVLRDEFPAPPMTVLDDIDPKVNIDIKNPASYSSIWSYMVNRCIYEVAAGGFMQSGNCMERIYLMAFHTYITTRLQKTNEAIDQWIRVSNGIVQDMLDNGISITAIKTRLFDYQQNFLLPMFIPGPDEDLRKVFGVSCADAGPKNFEKVCDALMAEARTVFAEVQDQVEQAFLERMQSWIDAFDRYLCALDKLVAYYTQPDIMMNYVFCGTTSDCARSLARRAQVNQDVLATGVGDDFMPFQNTQTMSKLALVGDQKRDMTGIVNAANALPGVLIDPATVAFVNDRAYERVLFESIASLDGKPTIEENVVAKGGVSNPNRVLYDQFRKPPRSGLLLTAPLQDGVYEPLFQISQQDPDGDQIILAYDLCPCAPEVLAKNALDSDNDRIGDTCDPDANASRFGSIIAGMPGSDFANQAVRDYFDKQFGELVLACEKDTTHKATAVAGSLAAELDDYYRRGEISHAATELLTEEVKSFAQLLQNGAMACADRPLPKVVTSCP